MGEVNFIMDPLLPQLTQSSPGNKRGRYNLMKLTIRKICPYLGTYVFTFLLGARDLKITLVAFHINGEIRETP